MSRLITSLPEFHICSFVQLRMVISIALVCGLLVENEQYKYIFVSMKLTEQHYG